MERLAVDTVQLGLESVVFCQPGILPGQDGGVIRIVADEGLPLGG